MDKQAWFQGLTVLLEEMGFPAEQDEGRIRFLLAEGSEEGAPVIGELFLASALALEPPPEIDYLQLSILLRTGLPGEHQDALRAFAARVNRSILGGAFGIHDGPGGSCFVEYAYDLMIHEEASGLQCTHMAETAVSLAEAYCFLAEEAFAALALGEVDLDGAWAMLQEEKEEEP